MVQTRERRQTKRRRNFVGIVGDALVFIELET